MSGRKSRDNQDDRIVQLKRQGHSTEVIRERLGVSRQAVARALARHQEAEQIGSKSTPT